MECATLNRRATRTDRADRPTRTEGINLCGLFRFPIEQYLERPLPSRAVRIVAVRRP
jgi:hypothetical protein